MAKKFYVTATDRFMSGWGMAKGKDNKLVIECDNYSEAEIVHEHLIDREEMKYVNIRGTKPYYNQERFYISYKTKEDAPAWFKKGGN